MDEEIKDLDWGAFILILIMLFMDNDDRTKLIEKFDCPDDTAIEENDYYSGEP